MHKPKPLYFKDNARAFLDNGFPIAPKAEGSKHPVWTENWRQYAWHPASQDKLNDWTTRFPGHGISILTGRTVMCFDIDEDTEDAVARSRQEVERVCGPTPLIRVGRAPRIAMMYRAAEPIVSARMPAHDILGMGTTVVAAGAHPVTGQSYTWTGPHNPGNIAAADLPPVTNAMVSEITEKWMCRKLDLKTVTFRLQPENLVVSFGGSRTKLIKQLACHIFRGRRRARQRMTTEVLLSPDIPNWGMLLVPDVPDKLLIRSHTSKLK